MLDGYTGVVYRGRLKTIDSTGQDTGYKYRFYSYSLLLFVSFCFSFITNYYYV